MALKSYRPVTPARRQYSTPEFSGISKKKPEKGLVEVKHSTGGRNNLGRITVRFRGGGHKRKYRIIDFKRDKREIPGKVAAIEYDPNRSAHIALIHYKDGEKRYILAPLGIKEGDEILASESADIKVGNCLPLKNIPAGTLVHNVELKPGAGGKLIRAAGTQAQLAGFDKGYAQIRMPSREIRLVPETCHATIGQVGNQEHENMILGKAGRVRWLGRKPHNRGVVMNPVDHPHGGGEGRSSGGRHPVSPWGQKAKGLKTRTNKSTSKYIIRKRKK